MRYKIRDTRYVLKRYICLIILIMTSIFLIGPQAMASNSDYNLYMKQGEMSSKWNSLVKAGFEAFDANSLETGAIFLQKAYDQGCRDGLLLFKLGLHAELGQNYPDAAKYFKLAAPKLKKKYPNYSQTKKIHEHLARVYYKSDQFEEALPEVALALENNPNNFMLLFIGAQIYREKKNYNQAIDYYNKALNSDIPKDISNAQHTIWTELMTMYFEQKKYALSLKYAQQILAINPTDATALSYRGAIQKIRYKKREQEAIKKIVQ